MCLKSNELARSQLANAQSVEAFRTIVNTLQQKYKPIHDGDVTWNGESTETEETDCNLNIPPWICQPYYRIPPEDHKKKLEDCQKAAERLPRPKYFDKNGNPISRKLNKKLKRLEHRAKIKVERHSELCEAEDCANTRGLKCNFNLCKGCCRKKCFDGTTNCIGHKNYIKGKQERVQLGKLKIENPEKL